MTERNLVEKSLLKTLVPPNALNAENFQELAGKAYVEHIGAGKTIFNFGDLDRKTIYLLEGSVELVAQDKQSTELKVGTDVAKHPLANLQPRKHTATALTDCKITRFDSDLLDILLTWDQLSGIEVSEIHVAEEGDDDSDWMTRMLRSRAFLRVPPANIQAMFMRIQEVPMSDGEVVIKQGDDGDFYYIIKNGRAKVTRSSKNGSELTLATLKDGDVFGEEALLSEAKRNATVVMDGPGSLMRLSKEDFNALLKEPMLSWLGLDAGQDLVKNGAKWLDVRLESEHANTGLNDSVNIPLFMLRMKVDSLDKATPYIAYCDTGRRSSAAAFLLSERGFQVYCLTGGLMEQAPPEGS
jgi:CRP-like cAMP-binding protein